ncbi:Uvr/REP helicase [carnivorous sponge associated iridovirus]|jgi:hypothetical protein|nr:Uvr/REP helicase [carnivorous sponge associated iridovirus]
MWFGKTNAMIENKMFLLLFWIAVILLLILLTWNWFSGTEGTYMDHTSMIWDLLGKKVAKPKKVSFESKGETECRRVIEKLLGKPFPKTRPNFMLNEVSGHNLELDCYNDELKLAVEYNGEQHYKYIPYFHKTKDAFYNLKYRDEMKQRLCKQNGVRLITVPYTEKNISEFITKQLENLRDN